MTPTSPLSGVAGTSRFSPVKSCVSSASGVDHANVHGLLSAETRREPFPPYVSSTSRRSTAIVAPSLATTRPSTLPVAAASAVQSAVVTPVRFPSSPSTTHQRWLSAPSAAPVSHPSRSTQSLSKVMSDLGRRYADSVSVCRASGARSLLAPPAASSGISYALALSTAASTGISYSLPLSSALAPSCRSSTGQLNTSHLSAGQRSSRPTPSRPVGSSPGNAERRLSAHEAYLQRRTANELVSLYNDLYATPQRQTSAAVTTISRSTFASSSQPLTHAPSLARYYHRPELTANQTPRPVRYAGPFPPSSLPNASSQQTASNAGQFTSSMINLIKVKPVSV